MIRNTMKWKIIYGLLALILAGGMAISPSPAIVRAEASSVSNVWVELSDDDNVNTTNTTLEYIIHFTTTTALTGGVDTVTVAFPDGTTDMAGEEGSGYAFILPSSIDKDYVAVDPVCHPKGRMVTLTVPQAVANSANVTAYFTQDFGLVNPATSAIA